MAKKKAAAKGKAPKKKAVKEAVKKKAAPKAKVAKKKAVKEAVKKKAAPKAKVAKKKAAKKTASKKKAAKKKGGKKKVKRQPNSAFMKPLQPDEALECRRRQQAALPRTQVVKKLWAYIHKNKLQDAKNRRMINADDKLRAVFGGKDQVSMFEMTKLVNKHLRIGNGPAVAGHRCSCLK